MAWNRAGMSERALNSTTRCSSSLAAIPLCRAGAGSVRLQGKGPQGAKPKGEAVADILAAIRERRG